MVKPSKVTVLVTFWYQENMGDCMLFAWNKTNYIKYICLLFHKTLYILFNTEWSHCKVCNRCASRKLNLLVGRIPHFNHQSSCIALIDVSSRFKGQGQILIGEQIHGEFFARFPFDNTRSVDHLYFSWIDGNISLAQQLYSVFYEG